MNIFGRRSPRGRYRRAAARILEEAHPGEGKPLDPAALADLPRAVRGYLERVGAVGRPRVRSFQARFRARIRGGPDEPWMEGTAEQVERFHPPERHFFMNVRRGGLPVHVYHRYVGAEASMHGRLLGLVPVVDASGPEMTHSETVTLLNDVVLFAPAALAELPITWEELPDGNVRAAWENAGHAISAVLCFDATGDLVDFWSRDRDRIEGDVLHRDRWSTPIEAYTTIDGRRVPLRAEARWGEPGATWSYVEFVTEDIRYDPASSR